MPTLLFLCTGNYYRSRFAEILFNHLAPAMAPAWRADSRALALERGILNPGPLSVHTRERLLALGMAPDPSWGRMPRAVDPGDFGAFDRVIALDEDEHRPLMHERHPQWEDLIEYWGVHDLDFTAPGEALQAIAGRVDGLIEGMEMQMAAGGCIPLPPSESVAVSRD